MALYDLLLVCRIKLWEDEYYLWISSSVKKGSTGLF